MADVQVERGHVRIANRVEEALTVADFTLTQLKVVHAIIRLSWGWRQLSVRVAMPDLAEYCGLKDSGGFRRDLRKLIEEGVIRELERAHGRTAAVYSFNKNFEKWGRYAVSLDRLVSLFRERPKSLYKVTPSGDDNGEFDTDDSVTPPGDENVDSVAPQGDDSADAEIPLTDSTESNTSLHGVTHEGPKSINGETLQPWKDRKTKDLVVSTDHITQSSISVVSGGQSAAVDGAEKPGETVPAEPTVTPPPETAGDDDSSSKPPRPATATRAQSAEPTTGPRAAARDYSIDLAVAANLAIEKRWGAQPNALRSGTGDQLAADLERRGVPRELACTVIARVVEQTKSLDRPPYTLEYFRNAILAAFDDVDERARQAAARSRVPETTTPTHISATVHADRERERQKREDDEVAEYERQRRAAATEWQRGPANKLALKALFDRVTEKHAGTPGDAFRTASITREVIAESARFAGFPDLETWRAQRRGAGAA